MRLSRRELLKAGIGVGASLFLPAGSLLAKERAVIQRKIPSSGESVPIIGIGTSRRYQGTTEAERAQLREVLRQFKGLGGKVIDTAPAYGNAETVVGDLVAELGIRDSLFIATKVGAQGREAGVEQTQ